jgi:hypothetical protein
VRPERHRLREAIRRPVMDVERGHVNASFPRLRAVPIGQQRARASMLRAGAVVLHPDFDGDGFLRN